MKVLDTVGFIILAPLAALFCINMLEPLCSAIMLAFTMAALFGFLLLPFAIVVFIFKKIFS